MDQRTQREQSIRISLEIQERNKHPAAKGGQAKGDRPKSDRKRQKSDKIVIKRGAGKRGWAKK